MKNEDIKDLIDYATDHLVAARAAVGDDGATCLERLLYAKERVDQAIAEYHREEQCGHIHYHGFGTMTCDLTAGHAGRHQQGACSWEGMFAHVREGRGL